ncbi:MAG: hypothetical protein M0T80_15190 [Actinomycetota bacterium]|nr:hypothetical protein [Actinomycetota bacterium]
MANQNDRDQGFFDKDTVMALMSELAEAMAADGIGAKIVIVGGGALCFVYDRQTTTDVDAAIYPKEAIAPYAAEIARRHDLRPDWLNDKAVGFFPHDDPVTIPVIAVGDVTVERVDTDVLLAMKLRACRPRKDLFDLAILLRRHDIRSLAEAEAWLDLARPVLPRRPGQRPGRRGSGAQRHNTAHQPAHQPGAGHPPGDHRPSLPALGGKRRRPLHPSHRSPRRPHHRTTGDKGPYTEIQLRMHNAPDAALRAPERRARSRRSAPLGVLVEPPSQP